MKLIRIVVMAAAAAAASLLLVPASPASAHVPSNASQITPYSVYVYGTPGSRVWGKAQCPAGTSVVAAAIGLATAGSAVPTADFTAVEGVGLIKYAAPSNYMIVTANCASNYLISGWTTATTEVPGSGWPALRRGVAWCPSGYFAFGGGGYFRNTQGGNSLNTVEMVSNAPSTSYNGQGWTFGGATFIASDVLVIRTRCAPAQGTVVVASHITASKAGGGVYAECGPSYFTISGGVYLSRPDGNEGTGNVLYSVWGGSDHWFAYGYSDDRSIPGTKLVALAVCVPLNS
jgi:hypothetical protein